MLCGVGQNDIILSFAGALVEESLFPLSRRFMTSQDEAWIRQDAGMINEFVLMHVDEWSHGASVKGLDIGAVADVQRACEEAVRRGFVLSDCC